MHFSVYGLIFQVQMLSNTKVYFSCKFNCRLGLDGAILALVVIFNTIMNIEKELMLMSEKYILFIC